MKKWIITAVVGLATLSLSAQKVIEKNFKYSGQFIDLNVKFASEIEVKTWDKSTVYLKADITTKNGKFIFRYITATFQKRPGHVQQLKTFLKRPDQL